MNRQVFATSGIYLWLFVTQILHSDQVSHVGDNVCYALFVIGYLCLTPPLTILQLYRGGQFYWREKLEYPK
jgi:hypothetical protein